MQLRAFAWLIVFAGCLVLTAAAEAQYYPAPPGGAYPPSSRMPAQPADDDDDDVDYLPPPGQARPPAAAPYPTSPYPDDMTQRRSGGAVESQALPAPGGYPAPALGPNAAPGAYPPSGTPAPVSNAYPAPSPGTYPAPAAAPYPAPAANAYPPAAPGPYGSQNPYGAQGASGSQAPAGRTDSRLGTAGSYGPDDATLAIRPPADLSPPQQGAILDLNRAPVARGEPGRPPAAAAPGATVASLPPEDQPETGERKELPQHLRRQVVDFVTKEPAGTIVVDTPNTYLYLVLGNGKAMRYGIGVGREGFTWSGVERITRMAEWPDWHPPAEMIERQPYLPRFMAGGESNPLGARALYLGKTVFRVHGTNQPSTIGTFVSSGCIRLVNEDISDLYGRVQVGTRVVVWPGSPPASASAAR
jgi:lipoprotein-anchoring transpeptidase ErfK/SrfK